MVTPTSTATGTLFPNWLLGQGLTGTGLGGWGKLMKKLCLCLFMLTAFNLFWLGVFCYWFVVNETEFNRHCNPMRACDLSGEYSDPGYQTRLRLTD
jgi:hypothetical protein